MSDSDFKQDIQPAGLPRKRYPLCKPRAAMGACFILRLFLKRSLKNSRELKKLLWQLFGKETALKWHFVYKLVNNQAKDGDGASPDRIVASQHNIMASQDNVVPSQDNVVPSQDMVALKVEVVALEVVLVEQDKLDELLKLCRHRDNYLCRIP